VTPSAIRGPANSEPHTKRIIGPNVVAAASPLKKSPGTEDSKFRVKRGDPSSVATALESSVGKIPKDCRWTR